MNQGFLEFLVGKSQNWHSIHDHMRPQLKGGQVNKESFHRPKLCPSPVWKRLSVFTWIGISITSSHLSYKNRGGTLQHHEVSCCQGKEPASTGLQAETAGSQLEHTERSRAQAGHSRHLLHPSPPETRLWRCRPLCWHASFVTCIELANSILESLAPTSTSGQEIHKNCSSFQSSNRIVNATFIVLDGATQPGRVWRSREKTLHQGN